MRTITLRTLPSLPLTTVLLLAACGDGSGTTADDASGASMGSTGEPEPTTAGPTTSGSTANLEGSSDGSASEGTTGTGPADGTTTDEATDATTAAEGLEIAGQWLEEFAPGMGIVHTIDEALWEQAADFGTAIFHVSAYDDEARWVVAQGDLANEFSPGLWSRFDWAWDGDALYYCTAVFDAATEADALAVPPSDAGDLAAGCGGFPWSPLVPLPTL